ncbi:hypothetical protein Lalb_Chr08g0232191 [Lupinus albus]|uniref:Uncharacterized protein n=1 Tax=Lupinus albus TaxID=3870 RepID=A0A6A4Q3M2_LUPAL|nr:hypothetical protein Lalb_Chr08g0232191 [Lupinus albus]
MCLKLKLKAWNRESFGCLDSKLIEHSKDVNSIVLEGELGDLEVQQVMLRKKFLDDWWSGANMKDNLFL